MKYEDDHPGIPIFAEHHTRSRSITPWERWWGMIMIGEAPESRAVPSSLSQDGLFRSGARSPSDGSGSYGRRAFRPLCPGDKRRRLLSDVDGEGSQGLQKKKRRLGLILVTSRLSPPFSVPATYIVSRGSSKIAVWAKQKALGRSSLQKAAIMNRIRRWAMQAKEGPSWRLEMSRQPFFRGISSTISLLSQSSSANAVVPGVMFPAGITGSMDPSLAGGGIPPSAAPDGSRSPPGAPRRQYIPLPPSPLSLTNYDVFDNEDGYFDSDSDSDADRTEDRAGLVYSDFNVLEPSESVLDDHDCLSAFDSLLFWNRWARESEESGSDDEESR